MADAVTSLSPRLPLRVILLFSTSSFGSEALSQARNLWLVYYYAPPGDADRTALLKLGAVGAILFASKLLEAFDDALIGYWSDRTRSRLGRRLPFILLATPLWALFAFLLFTPPEGSGSLTIGLYLFVIYELYSLFSTLSGGPYEALLPEIARTGAERVRLISIRVYFGVAGAAAGLVLTGLLKDAFGFQAMALAMAALALAARYAGMFGVWKYVDREQPAATLSLRESLRSTFSNASFLCFLPTFVLFQAGVGMLIGVLPYYVNAVLGREEEGTWVSILTAVAIGAMLLAVPFFARLARRRSTAKAFSWAMLGAAATFPLLFVAGFVPGIPREAQIIVTLALIGVPLAGVYLFPAALTADICDDDERQTGMRREATFFGAQNFVEKAAGSLSPLLLALVLLLGSTADNSLGIRLVGPVAALLTFGGYLVFRRYELDG